MRKLTPINVEGDSAEIHEALNRMFVRCAKMSRKRPSPVDIKISLASIDVIVAMERYFDETMDLAQTIARIDRIFKMKDES